jgi:hypothetical protein
MAWQTMLLVFTQLFAGNKKCPPPTKENAMIQPSSVQEKHSSLYKIIIVFYYM